MMKVEIYIYIYSVLVLYCQAYEVLLSNHSKSDLIFQLIDEIWSRNCLPVIVGGTNYYIQVSFNLLFHWVINIKLFFLKKCNPLALGVITLMYFFLFFIYNLIFIACIFMHVLLVCNHNESHSMTCHTASFSSSNISDLISIFTFSGSCKPVSIGRSCRRS